MTSSAVALGEPLALFPLRSVLFPDGQLGLKVFEARYLDLISACLREQRAFGVVCLNQGGEVRLTSARPDPGQAVSFEPVGTLAHLEEVDAESAGLLMVRCRGGARFHLDWAAQQADGLWLAQGVSLLPDDPLQPPGPRFRATVNALARAIALLDVREPGSVPAERRLDDAGWVANRWCEWLPIDLAARQQLMVMSDPLARLEAVDAVLRQHQLI